MAATRRLLNLLEQVASRAVVFHAEADAIRVAGARGVDEVGWQSKAGENAGNVVVDRRDQVGRDDSVPNGLPLARAGAPC